MVGAAVGGGAATAEAQVACEAFGVFGASLARTAETDLTVAAVVGGHTAHTSEGDGVANLSKGTILAGATARPTFKNIRVTDASSLALLIFFASIAFIGNAGFAVFAVGGCVAIGFAARSCQAELSSFALGVCHAWTANELAAYFSRGAV